MVSHGMNLLDLNLMAYSFRFVFSKASMSANFRIIRHLFEVCETFQLLRQRVLKPSKPAVFPRDVQENTFSMSAKKQKSQKNVPKECNIRFFVLLFCEPVSISVRFPMIPFTPC